MKKLVAVTVLGALVVGGVVLAQGPVKAATPEGRACVRMAELCGREDAKSEDFDKCVDDMKSAKKMAGEPSFKRSLECIDESKTCAAAAGCWAGGVGMGAVGEMMKGFGSALTK
jgi:hypothetical protein